MLSLLLVLAVILVLLLCCSRGGGERFTKEDKKIGQRALKQLNDLLDRGESIETVDDATLIRLDGSGRILLVKQPNVREGMSYFQAENTRYWPNYFYSFPYNYKYGGAWPPGMYSRLYNWSPGFYSGSGWSYHMRPGIGYKYWPRNRWIRSTKDGNHSYYYVTNRDDYIHDAANYADTPLVKG